MDQDVLDHYEPIVQKIVAKGYSIDTLAASLLKDALTLHDMVEESDLNDHNFNKQGRSNERGGRRDSRGDRGSRGERSSRADRASGSPSGKRRNTKSSGQTRMFVSVGKAHKATVSDLLGAITGECQVNGRSIGAIDMYDKFSFVDVEDRYVDQVIKHLKDKRIKGRIVNVEVAKS
jgi:ATP-dependent RNA helicase DeaD